MTDVADKSVAALADVHENWSSTFIFVLAALGSAVGLGNIWRFPYVVGENGGGAFVLVYLFFIVAIGLPALIATVMIGRRGRMSPIQSMVRVARLEGRSRHWGFLGWALVLGAFFLLSLFSVVASWIMDYFFKAGRGAFADIDADGARLLFDSLKADPVRVAAWHGAFMVATLLIVGRGVRKGIERAVKIMMPTLFLLMAILTCYALITGDMRQAIQFLFAPDFSKIDGAAVLLAVGQALLSLSVGGAGMLIYGAYLSEEASIPKSCGVIALADTTAALLAGLMIFPIVFAYGMAPSQGPGLIFVTLPIAFGQMPAGTLVALAFFLLLFLAALSSSISMLEPLVAHMEERLGLKRYLAASLTAGALWLVGLLGVFSFNLWAEFRPLRMFDSFTEFTIFQSMEFVITSLILPVSTFMLAVFVGWFFSEQARAAEFGMTGAIFKAWRLALRYFVPVALAVVFAATLI